MGGDLDIEWDEPEALFEPRSGAGSRGRIFAALVVFAIGSTLFAAWPEPLEWLRGADALSMGGAALFAGAIVLRLIFLMYRGRPKRDRFHVTADEIGVPGAHWRTPAWEHVVCFEVRPVEGVPGVDKLSLYCEASPGDFAPLWQWLSGAQAEGRWYYFDIPLPVDTELGRRIIDEVDRRATRKSELTPEKRGEVDARLDRAHSGASLVLQHWAEWLLLVVVGAALGVGLGVLVWRGELPKAAMELPLVIATLFPLAILGPATWLALVRVGRAGFARAAVRLEVLGGNACALFLAWIAAGVTAAWLDWPG